jgi:lipopolysaccharide/colanic/teichoic acid biosynthesis glycosyltransferase
MTTEVIPPPSGTVTGEVGVLLRPQPEFGIHEDDFFGYDAVLRPASHAAAYEVAKRGIDIVGACLLLVALSPLILLVALWIKLTDFGPVIFSQNRVGRDGEEFKFYKFRSMDTNAEDRHEDIAHLNHHDDERTFKVQNDPRVTRVGRWIRRYSVDEIPQLWNVLLGDMSLVGPRPPVPREVELYTRFDRRRFEVKPGLTCVWQVRGRGNVGFDKQILMDVEYIEQRNLLLDFKLMVLTVPAVFSGNGAY